MVVERTERAASAVGWSSGRERLAELYTRSIGPAMSLARLLTSDPGVAEDIAQEAFVRAAGRLGSLREPAAFDLYLRRTVVNLCRARFRRLRVERAYLRRQPSSAAASEPDPTHRDALWAALRELPYRQRAAVVLRFFEDLSEEQAGHVLRCSPRAVNALVSRAMATLRDRIRKEELDDD